MKAEPQSSFRCKKCRAVLFESFVHGMSECTSVFIDQPKWLDVGGMENEVKFRCPKCNTKIGEVIFSGKKCSCLKWVVPAFQVHRSKVDQIRKHVVSD